MTLIEIRQRIEKELDRSLPIDSTHSEQLVQAVRWSVLGGGKRLRGTLTCAVATALGTPDLEELMDLAVAIELIHAYSLVHDDLPAMDDADLRRGKASTQKKFGEALAILAGDGLQTLAFEQLVRSTQLTDSQKTRAVLLLSNAAGWEGMVGGQAWDISKEHKPETETELAELHSAKTGRLFKAAVMFGLIPGNNDLSDELHAWGSSLGSELGLIFQMVDDVIDVTQSSAVSGKPHQIDEAHSKVTYPSLLGLETTRKRISESHQAVVSLLEQRSLQTSLLTEVVDQCVRRVS